ncbi:unnamed protein product [Aphanomyces euteiches]
MTLFVNGLIWQWAPRNGPPSASRDFAGYANWFTVDGDTISAIGHGEEPSEVREKHVSSIVDLEGQMVIPGLHDSHIHIYHMGEVAHYVDLRGADSFDELKARVIKHGEKYPEVDWIVGFGWEQDKLSPDARYPSREFLDSIPVHRPIYLWRTCFHIAVVNSAALTKAGLEITPDPSWAANVAGGVVDLDAQGLPTGILRESAVNLVQKYIIEKSDEIRLKYLRIGLQTCLEFGLTAVHTNDPHCLPLYHHLQKSKELPLRVYMTPDQHELEDSRGALGPPVNDGLIKVDRVKLFGDGSLGAETAALRQPYRNSTNIGVLMENDDAMLAKIQVAHQAGYRVEIHAIGDRAAAQVLAAMGSVPNIDRPLLTHCQILGPDLLDAMASLNVVANIQPSFVVTDATFASKRLPVELLPYSRTMMKAGIVCAGGSDAPIETSNPFQGMYDAIHRSAPLDDPQECLTFTQALQLYTLNGAYAAKEETRLGEIAPGFQADFVVVKYDLLASPDKLLAPDVLSRVFVQGVQRFDAKNGRNSPLAVQAAGLPGKNGKIRICRCCRV